MSINSEISRLSGNVSDALDAIADKGVTVPAGANSNNLATLIASIPTGGGDDFITGTQTANTRFWTGTASFDSLEHGQTIIYWLPRATAAGDAGNRTCGVSVRYNSSTTYAAGTAISSMTGEGSTSSTDWLNLTLSDGTETGWIPCYYSGATRLTSHYAAGNAIRFIYLVNASVAGVLYTGWWADANYVDGNTYDRIRLNNSIKAKTAIVANTFIVGDDSGYFQLGAGTTFNLDRGILWAGSAISAASTGTNNYIAMPSCTLRNNTTSTFALTTYKNCWLVGTLSNNTFTPATTFFTDTVPTAADGLDYILLGPLVSTYQIYLLPDHPIYKFLDGNFVQISQVPTRLAAVDSNGITRITTTSTGSLNLYDSSSVLRAEINTTDGLLRLFNSSGNPVIVMNDSTGLSIYDGTDSGTSTSRIFRVNISGDSPNPLPVNQGGTGITSNPSMLVKLGETTADDVFKASPRPGITGTLGVAHGGTGRTTITENALMAGNGTGQFKIISSANGAVYATSAGGEIKFGALPIAQGGTGSTSAADARTALGAAAASTKTNASVSANSAYSGLTLSNGEIAYLSYKTTYTSNADISFKVNGNNPESGTYRWSGNFADNSTTIARSGSSQTGTFSGFIAVHDGFVEVWGGGRRGSDAAANGMVSLTFTADSVSSITFSRAGRVTWYKLS